MNAHWTYCAVSKIDDGVYEVSFRGRVVGMITRLRAGGRLLFQNGSRTFDKRYLAVADLFNAWVKSEKERGNFL